MVDVTSSDMRDFRSASDEKISFAIKCMHKHEDLSPHHSQFELLISKTKVRLWLYRAINTTLNEPKLFRNEKSTKRRV